VPLEVTVKANHITEIHCGGRPLDQLVDFTNSRVAAAPSCEGRFGLLNSAGAATFRNGRFESLNDTTP
jgi:hypothetical protein